MTKHYCDGCGVQMYREKVNAPLGSASVAGYWILRHSDSKPWEVGREVCWECYYKLFPGAEVKL